MNPIRILTLTALLALTGMLGLAQAAVPTVTISNVPMTLVQPTPPQVLLTVTNSQSMDGNLSGAIMTGSGSVNNAISSPPCYVISPGFTPPILGSGAGGCPTGQAPYTVNVSGTLQDNGPSRLNVAKVSLKQIIQHYAVSFNMGLMVYNTQYPSLYATWVYYMSAQGTGFQFSNSNTAIPPTGTTRWVLNPCYKQTGSDCAAIVSIDGNDVLNDQYIAVQATSDQPKINDVLYAPGSYPDNFLIYNGPSPASPYPPNFTLLNYENGTVRINYKQTAPNVGGFGPGPTNAGYVPYSNQVLNFKRGFGYYTSQSATTGNLLVPIQPAGIVGKPATQAQINKYTNLFAPYLAQETNDPDSGEIKALATQSPMAGLFNGALKYFTGTNAPTASNGCPAKRYVVVVTDGLPTEDLNGHSWPPLGSSAAVGYKLTATFNLVGGGTISTAAAGFAVKVLNNQTTSLASTKDQALTDAITKLQALNTAGIKTYIVGMGAGVNPNKNPAAAATLKAMAIAGGTRTYFAGTSAQAVVQDLQVVFGQIQAANMSTTSVAVNSGSIQNNTKVFQARFASQTSPYLDWTGNLFAFPINSNLSVNTSTSNAAWQAALQLDTTLGGTGWQSFPTFTWNDSSNPPPKGASFAWSSINATQQADLEQYWASLTTTQQTAFGNQAAYGKAVLNFLKGNQNQSQANGGIFRNRSMLMGDIVDSSPLYVGLPAVYDGISAPSGSTNATLTAYSAASTAYASFTSSTANRTPTLYVGANNGMLYGIDATSGAPLFSYVPRGVYADLANLSQPSYNASHRFYVDGPASAGDVPFTSGSTVTWHTILAGGLDAGGKDIYALDVTHPSQILAQNVLWDITDNTPGFSQLGLSYSAPQIAVMNINNINNTPVPTPVVIFGNGYNSAGGSPYLYVVNAQTGSLLHSFNLCASGGIEPLACVATKANGLSTPSVIAAQGGGIATRAYAGDLQGNLWRFDLSSPDPLNWTARVLFQARGPSGKTQPITTTPVVSSAPRGINGQLVFFGTGQLLGAPDLTNTNTQSFYGVLDNGGNSALTTTISNPQWLVRSNLQPQVIKQTTYTGTDANGNVVTKTVRTITTQPVNLAIVDGWYTDLPLAGERVITNPSVFGQEVVFTTNVPATNVCGGGIQSWLMAVNFATGGSFNGVSSLPMLDLNNDGLITSADEVNGQFPIGVSQGNTYSSSAMVTPTGSHSVKYTSQSNLQISAQKERAGLKSGRATWVELR